FVWHRSSLRLSPQVPPSLRLRYRHLTITLHLFIGRKIRISMHSMLVDIKPFDFYLFRYADAHCLLQGIENNKAEDNAKASHGPNTDQLGNNLIDPSQISKQTYR